MSKVEKRVQKILSVEPMGLDALHSNIEKLVALGESAVDSLVEFISKPTDKYYSTESKNNYMSAVLALHKLGNERGLEALFKNVKQFHWSTTWVPYNREFMATELNLNQEALRIKLERIVLGSDIEAANMAMSILTSPQNPKLLEIIEKALIPHPKERNRDNKLPSIAVEALVKLQGTQATDLAIRTLIEYTGWSENIFNPIIEYLRDSGITRSIVPLCDNLDHYLHFVINRNYDSLYFLLEKPLEAIQILSPHGEHDCERIVMSLIRALIVPVFVFRKKVVDFLIDIGQPAIPLIEQGIKEPAVTWPHTKFGGKPIWDDDFEYNRIGVANVPKPLKALQEIREKIIK